MKQTIYILIMTFCLINCSNKKERTAVKRSPDTLKIISNSKIYIKDKSLYDQIFIEGLTKYNKKIKLIGNYIITENDTIYFPEDLPLNKIVLFSGNKNNNRFELGVKRKNLTTLNYNFNFIDRNNKTINKNGKAVLNSLFFLASEIDEDDLTGDAYESVEYREEKNDCWVNIRIGLEKDENGKQRAIIKFGCSDKNKESLELNECPTLR